MSVAFSAWRSRLFTTLPTPSTSAEMVMGFKADGNLYKKTSAGVETLLQGVTGPIGPTGPTGSAGQGSEGGYVERTTSYTSTNTTAFSTSALITGLSIVVTGAGRPVEIEFFVPGAQFSTVNSFFHTFVNMNGAGITFANSFSPSTTLGPAMIAKARKTLTSGTSYTFTCGTWSEVAGTTTLAALTSAPIYLSVVLR